MTEHRDLLALVADVRALVEDARLRGAFDEAVIAAPAAPRVDPAPTAHRGPPTTTSTPQPPPPVHVPPPAGSAWAQLAADARTQATAQQERGARGLERIREDLGDCRRCKLCKDRRSIVYGVGQPEARLMVIGEGPGHDEDLKGEPFVGAAGQMLDRMLANVLGTPRERVYIANVVKCRPPNNRNPEPDEVAACRPFLERQIAAVAPRHILLLGAVALKSLFPEATGIMRHRGQWMAWQDIPVMPTFHPAYLLRNPADKNKTFDDLKALKAAMASLPDAQT